MNRFLNRSRKGISLTELLIAMAVLGIITLLTAPFFTLTQRGFTSMEAHNSLKSGGQEAINKMGNKLSQCKRLFENTAESSEFLSRVTMTTAPAVLAGSHLPIISENGSLSPGTTGFIAANAGNSLFFASVEAPKDLGVVDSTDAYCQARIDHYQFNYFFLAEDNAVSIHNQPKINLWHWQSIKYADYTQIANIADPGKKADVVRVLVASGTTLAWDPSATDVDAAFFSLDASGSLSPEAGHVITEEKAEPLIVLVTGMTMGGYRYGISSNSGVSNPSPKTVPVFAQASGKFPSGFETLIVGPNSARQVLIRLVIVALGSFKGTIANEQLVLTTARDLW